MSETNAQPESPHRRINAAKQPRKSDFNVDGTLRNIKAWERVTARQRAEDEEALDSMRESFGL